ncbi:hypothetical protein JHK87_006558 [Glycine soja]|nr:hypothetical protein JHK87_006558 [Glycine soja]
MESVLANHFESTQEPGRLQGFIRLMVALSDLNGSQVHSWDETPITTKLRVSVSPRWNDMFSRIRGLERASCC